MQQECPESYEATKACWQAWPNLEELLEIQASCKKDSTDKDKKELEAREKQKQITIKSQNTHLQSMAAAWRNGVVEREETDKRTASMNNPDKSEMP